MSTLYPTIEWPPLAIPAGGTWTKDNVDTTLSRTGTTLPKYKTTLTNTTAFYGLGQYIAYANTIYNLGSTFEMPPAGAFDKRDGGNAIPSQGWAGLDGFLTNTADASPPGILYVELPEAIALQSYTIKARPDCCATQNATKWDLHGSNDRTTWTLLNSQVNQAPVSIGSARTYTTNLSAYYSMYRLSVYRGNNSAADYLVISELILNGRSSSPVSMSNVLTYGKAKIAVPSTGYSFSSFLGKGGLPATGPLSFSNIVSRLSLY